MLKFFRLPFATTGDKTAVPDAVDSNGNVSYSQGYGFDYQRQKTDPAAKNIERDKMNQILFDITTAIAEIQAQGVPDYITSALNGGSAYSYGQYAIVKYSGAVYISLVAANTALPSDATKWALLPTPALLQQAAYMSAVADGTVDALTAAFTPAIASLPAAPGTLSVFVRATGANTSTTPTFKADGTAAKTIVKGANRALVAGDIAGAGHWLELQYDATLDKWVLQNPAFGVNVVSVKQIQTVGATVAANAMTVTLNPTSLDFRSTTQNSGAVNTRSNAAQLSLTIPSTATLGTVSGVASRILILAIDNAGTMELAVYNAAGGANLDETGVINTTAIAAGANSLTVYSQTARTGVPYRIVGFVDSTQATAGTWATAPSAVQGIGGQALAAMSSIGYGQTWQDVTGSRASGTTYYNTTGKPIAISIRIGITATSTNYLAVNGVTIAQNSGNGTGSGVAQIVAIVPPGGNYLYTAGGGSVIAWNELR